MRQSIVAALLMLCLFAVARPAHATNNGTGYVCTTQQYPGASAYGNFGWITVSLYSGPSCTGSYVDYYTFCSTGASAPSECTPWPYSEAGLVSLQEGLRAAAAVNQKVSIYVYQGNAWSVAFDAAGY